MKILIKHKKETVALESAYLSATDVAYYIQYCQRAIDKINADLERRAKTTESEWAQRCLESRRLYSSALKELSSIAAARIPDDLDAEEFLRVSKYMLFPSIMTKILKEIDRCKGGECNDL